jgi:hypothetical protein
MTTTTTTEYRAMAEECFRWAHEATTPNTRSAYLEIAKIWLTAADVRQDGELPIRYPHIDDDAASPDTGHLQAPRLMAGVPANRAA